MQIANKLMMLSIAVNDMPKAKAFYTDKLSLKVRTDYRLDDSNWWVALTLPEGKTSITLTTNHENMKPGSLKFYFSTADITNSHKELSAKDAKLSEVKDDLFGPGSGVKWFSLNDPDNNQILVFQS